jgi:hypothetical protein
MAMDDDDPIGPVLGPPPRLDDEVWMSAIAGALQATEAEFDATLLPGPPGATAVDGEVDGVLSSDDPDGDPDGDGHSWREPDHDEGDRDTDPFGDPQDPAGRHGETDGTGSGHGPWPGPRSREADGDPFAL